MAEIKKAYLGSTLLKAIYAGDNKAFDFTADTTAPTTTPRPLDTVNNPTNTYTSAQTVYLDVNELATTYYTTDGTTPVIGQGTTQQYTAAIPVNSTTTLKYFSVDQSGNKEAVKTTVYTINIVVAPTTTISPTAPAQNSIPITVTLTTSEAGATIYYQLGNGTTLGATVYTYTGPFTVNQNSAGVLSTNIQVAYWSVGANATEAQKSITYDTSGAVPSVPVLTATGAAGKVSLSWTQATNTTSYTVYRSDVAGTLGTWIGASQYLGSNVFSMDDTTVTAGQTYYYTVRAGNYGPHTDSTQKAATPTAAVTGYRYIRVDGYGEYYTGAGYTNTRLIELEIFSGGVNILRSPSVLIPSSQAVATGAETGSTAPTKVTDGVKGITSNTYNIWWSDVTLNGNAGNAWVFFDLGSSKNIDSIRYWGYTSRAPRFKIYGSNNAADFGANGAHGNATLLWDMSTNDGTTLAGATAGTNNYVEKIGGF